MNFLALLESAQARSHTTIALGLAPALDTMPAEIARHDDPFLPFGKAVIDATNDLVCAYVFHLGAYLSAGASGAVALERTMAYVPAGILKVLHGPFVTAEYARAAFEEGFGADAVTLARPVEQDAIKPYLAHERYGVFFEVFSHYFLPELHSVHPGQVFTYYRSGQDYYACRYPDLPLRGMHWHWGPHVYRSRRLDFQDVLRQTVKNLYYLF